MKIIVRNGSVSIRVPVPRGVRVLAYSSGLFFAGSLSKVDFGILAARGFEVDHMRSGDDDGYLVSWVGGYVGFVGPDRWFIVCK